MSRRTVPDLPAAMALLERTFGETVVPHHKRLSDRGRKVWVIVLSPSGVVLVLGSGTMIRDEAHLSGRLADIGMPPVDHVGALAVFRALRAVSLAANVIRRSGKM